LGARHGRALGRPARRPARGRDRLVAPAIQALADDLRSGRATVGDPGNEDWSVSVVPRGLAPFVRGRRIELLRQGLAAAPWLYWHPIVRVQMEYLWRLLWDPRLWDDVGWDVFAQRTWRPRQADTKVPAGLRQLIEIHAMHLLPGLRIEWKAADVKRGPRAGIPNPLPTGFPDEWVISPATLAQSHRMLCAILRGQLTSDAPLRLARAILPATRERLVSHAFEALRRSNLAWSAAKKLTAGTEEVTITKDGAPLGPWRQVVYEWQVPNLRSAIDAFCDDRRQRQRMEKDGVPATLAHVILATLLNVTPDRVRNAIESYRRTQRTPRRLARLRRD